MSNESKKVGPITRSLQRISKELTDRKATPDDPVEKQARSFLIMLIAVAVTIAIAQKL